jgi:autotransporter-associated beta strand protein
VGLRFKLPSWVQGELRRSAIALASGLALAVASLLTSAPALAQSLWQGTTSTYETNTNWLPPTTPPSPPIGPGQLAVFDTGPASTTINVTSSSIAPNSWTFNAGAQSYTISGGAVNFSLAGPLGGIIDNANAGQTITISNNIGESVAGVQVQLNGSSTLVLSGANSYSGGTAVSNGGTLLVTNDSSVGTGTVTLSDGVFKAAAITNRTFANNFQINNTPFGSAIDADGVVLTIAGNITDGNGPGKLTVLDSIGASHGGFLKLLGTNTYSGGTFICDCALLQLGDPTHTASILGDVTNEGTLRIFNANTSGITSITNDGSFGHGTTFFSNATNAGTAAIVNQFGGTTVFNDSSSAMNAKITNSGIGDSTLFFNNSSAGNAVIINKSPFGSNPSFPTGLGFFDNSTAANATIVNSGLGLVAFGSPGGTDTSTAGNANITNNANAAFGGVLFQAFSTAGNAIITANNGSLVVFTDNATGGNAQFITNGSGTVDFSQSAGPIGNGVITAGSIAGSGTYIIGGIELVVGGNNLSTEVSGVISDGCGCGGSGLLTKVGSGTLTLSGVNTYTGPTNVDGGTLLVTGSIANSAFVVVDTGATLGGTGTVAQTFLTGGATLAPGLPTALGTLTVNDGLFFCSCTFYNVKVTSAGSDLTQVVANLGPPSSAVANLAGTVQVTSLNSSYKFNSPYTILTAQGGFDLGSGPTRFDSLMTPAGIKGSLSYTATDVDLTLLSALGQLPGLNVNQHNVATALDFGFNTTGNSGGLGAIFNGNIPLNLTQASGEIATGTQQATFNAMSLFLSLLTDPFLAGRDGGVTPGGAQPYAEDSEGSLAYAAKKQNAARDALAKMPTKADAGRNDLFDPHWSIWGSAYGGGANIDGNAALGSNSASVRAFGFVGGADYRISRDTIAGFALAGGGTNFSVNGFGTGRSDLFQAGAFVRHNVGAAYVTAAAAYGWQDVTTDRTVTIAGLDHLRAEFSANAFSGRVEGGYRFVTPWMGVTPYAAGQFTTFSLPAYAEQVLSGTPAFALNYAAKDVTDPRTELGVRTDRSYAMQNAILILRSRFAWAHDFNTDRNIAALFQTLPGASFVVNGAAQSHDSALTTGSVEMRWLNGWSAAATFEGEFSDISQSYAGKGVVRYAW